MERGPKALAADGDRYHVDEPFDHRPISWHLFISGCANAPGISYPIIRRLIFNTELSRAFSLSRNIFDTHPTVSDLRFYVTGRLEEDFDMDFSTPPRWLWTLELMIAEGGRIGLSTKVARRCAVTVQCASLLHDLKRKEPNHAVKGAAHAAVLLEALSFFNRRAGRHSAGDSRS